MSTIEKISFSIEGKFLVDLARTRVIEGDWEEGLRLLQDGLCDISYEICIDILSGKKTLAGTNNFQLIDDDLNSEENIKYIKKINYLYSSIVKVNKGNFGKWYKPYAIVTSVGANDYYKTLSNTYGLTVGDCKGKSRASYYVDDAIYDITFYPKSKEQVTFSFDENYKFQSHYNYYEEMEGKTILDYPIAILFKKCDSPPMWLPVNNGDFQLAFENCMKNGIVLEERGYAKLNDKIEMGHVHTSKGDIVLNVKEGEEIPSICCKEDESRYFANMFNPTPIESKIPIEDTDFSSDLGYILPDGRFFGCLYYEHHILSWDIFEHIIGLKKEEISDPEQMADNRGWVRISKAIGFDKVYFRNGKKELTQPQIDKLFDYCQKFEIEFPKHLMEES